MSLCVCYTGALAAVCAGAANICGTGEQGYKRVYITCAPSLPRQVRFRLQVPVQLACLALSLALPVAVCGACTPGLRCLARLYAAQLLLGGVLPAAIVHFSERRFRRNFFSQLHQA